MTTMKFIAVFAAFSFRCLFVEASQLTIEQPYFNFSLVSRSSICNANFQATEFNYFYSCLFHGFEFCTVRCSCSSGFCWASYAVTGGNEESQFGCRYYSCSYSNSQISCQQTDAKYTCSALLIENDYSSCDLRVIRSSWNIYRGGQIYFQKPSDFVSCRSNCSCDSTTTKPTTRTTKFTIPTTKRTTTGKSPANIKTTATPRKTSTQMSTRPITMKLSSKSSISYTGVTKLSTLSNQTSPILSTSSSTVVSTNDTSSLAASEQTSSSINSALIAGLTVPAIILSVLAIVGGWCIWRRRRFPKKLLPPAHMLPNNAPSIHENDERFNAKPEVHYSGQYFNTLDNNLSQELTKHVYQNIANENRKTNNICGHASKKSSIVSQPIASDSVDSNARSLVGSFYVNYHSRDNGHIDPDAATSTSGSKSVISLPNDDSNKPDATYFTVEENSSDGENVTNPITSAGVYKNVRSFLVSEDGQDSATIYSTLEEDSLEFDKLDLESAGTCNPAFSNDDCDRAINGDIKHKRKSISPDVLTNKTSRNLTNIKGVLRYQSKELNTNADACKQSTVTENEYELIGTDNTYEFVNLGGFSNNPKVNVIHEANDDSTYSKASSIVCVHDGAARTKPPNAYAKLNDIDRNIVNPYDMSPGEIEADKQVPEASMQSVDSLNPYSLAEIDPYTFSYTDLSDDVTSVVSSVDA